MIKSLVRRALFSASFFFFVASLSARQPWLVLNNCQVIANESNDGDSFHVRAAGQEYIFRLYFVDAPETDASFPERVGEQAKYFHLTQAETLQLGDFAKRFTKERLARPFIVRTCMQDALGRSARERFYGFIETGEGDLAELLVANGMARVHGSVATPIGLSSPGREREKLERLEREAKAANVGGWGASSGRMTARLPRQLPKSGPDSFDAFFHPERLAAPAETEAVLKTNQTPAVSADGKLDLNTASSEELLRIPGVGPVLAARIMAARPFQSADDLRKVKGIGAKKFSKIRPFFAPATSSETAR